ncbi:hypothetical protein PROFUN_03549 [Planoprotostelium fungivorum]|uniref:Uncharacterized protein n=1 Tax=Planoprotostelium fungivorum TaxID=1890364 RepID=A0A2P6MSG4_9EUKA|nr:hypothetical protein PROFUN_03549 [Planoprotostelium fungivorum]
MVESTLFAHIILTGLALCFLYIFSFFKNYGPKIGIRLYATGHIIGLTLLVAGTWVLCPIGITQTDQQIPRLSSTVTHAHIVAGHICVAFCMILPFLGGLSRYLLNHYENVHNREFLQSWYYEFATSIIGRILLAALLPITVLLGILSLHSFQGYLIAFWVIPVLLAITLYIIARLLEKHVRAMSQVVHEREQLIMERKRDNIVDDNYDSKSYSGTQEQYSRSDASSYT